MHIQDLGRAFRRVSIMLLSILTIAACSPPASLSVSLQPESVTVTQGASATVTATLSRQNVSGSVDMTGSAGGADGITVTFDPNPIPSGESEASMTVEVANTATAQDYTVSVTAESGGVRSSANLVLTVQVQGPTELAGEPGDPANDRIPDMAFESSMEDYSTDHPDLPGPYISFNSLMFSFTEGTTVSEANDLLRSVDATIVGGVSGSSADGVPGILFVRLPVQSHEELSPILDALRSDGRVQNVVPDVLLGGNALPRPNGGNPSGWTWEATPTSGNWGFELSRVPQMWNLNASIAKQGGSTVTAVLDTGFFGHPDLVYDQNLTPGVQDDHGTHVTGTIGATFDNGTGVDGLNPYTDLVVRAWSPSGLVSIGNTLITGYRDLLTTRSDIRAINVSLGYNWGDEHGLDANSNVLIHSIVTNQGNTFSILQRRLLLVSSDYNTFDDFPLIVVSAGNDSNDGVGIQDARWSSPYAFARIVNNEPNVIIVESVDHAPGMTGSAQRSNFSNTGGDISAPGGDDGSGTNVLSTGPSNNYVQKAGTSMAAPHVTGLIGYLYSIDDTLTHDQIKSVLFDNAVDVASANGADASNRMDAFASMIDLDRVTGIATVLKRWLDIDDGTVDGNQWVEFDTSIDFTQTDADNDGGIGDGNVDMADFRRFRDWLLLVEDDSALSLAGSASHPKRDVNGNSAIESPGNENLYPRADFNGDGVLSRTASRDVPGFVAATATDLEVLQVLFSDPNYAASELPGLLDSADLTIWPRSCLDRSDVAEVITELRQTGTTTPLSQRSHTTAQPRGIHTAPLLPSGTTYTAEIRALDGSGTVVYDTSTTFPFDETTDLGRDFFWDPDCSGFPEQWGSPAEDAAAGTATDLDGNVFVVGSTDSALYSANSGASDAWIVKYDADSSQLWAHQFGTGEAPGTFALDVATDEGGNAYVVGSTVRESGSGPDGFLVKYGPDGGRLWDRYFGSVERDTTNAVSINANNEIYATGTTEGDLFSSNSGAEDFFVVKYDTNGTEQWSRQIGTTAVQRGLGIGAGSNEAYVAGATDGESFGAHSGGLDAFLARIDASGNVDFTWSKQFGTANDDVANGVALASASEIYVVGSTGQDLFGTGSHSGGQDAYVRKYDGSGAEVWQQQFGSSGADHARAITADSDGNAYVSGDTAGAPFTGTNTGGLDAFVVKYDSGGAIVWDELQGTSGAETGEGIAIDLDRNTFVAGATEGDLFEPSEGATDAYVLKLGPGGTPVP